MRRTPGLQQGQTRALGRRGERGGYSGSPRGTACIGLWKKGRRRRGEDVTLALSEPHNVPHLGEQFLKHSTCALLLKEPDHPLPFQNTRKFHLDPSPPFIAVNNPIYIFWRSPHSLPQGMAPSVLPWPHFGPCFLLSRYLPGLSCSPSPRFLLSRPLCSPSQAMITDSS